MTLKRVETVRVKGLTRTDFLFGKSPEGKPISLSRFKTRRDEEWRVYEGPQPRAWELDKKGALRIAESIREGRF